MTLSIIDSMLRGDLRRQVLVNLKTEKEISLLWRDLFKAVKQGEQSLMAIENALISAVEKSGFVKISDDYEKDRELRQGAEETRNLGVLKGDDNYTIISKTLSLEGIFAPYKETTPTDKFLNLLVKTECRRTIECMKMLVSSVHDDAVVRSSIRKLFSSITCLCRDANDLYIQEVLTQFYFELYHTFKSVLEKGALQNYETDFENFVFQWKGEFPDSVVVEHYNEKIKSFAPTINEKQASINSFKNSTQVTLEKAEPKDKFDRFLEEAEKYTFTQIPKVKELGTSQKIRKLVECMLQDKETTSDTFGHTAAMLEFLGFYKWISDNHISGYRLNKYDAWCTRYIMQKNGNSFRHYRISVKISSNDISNSSWKYKGWEYKSLVEEEYNRILKS